MDGPRDAYCDNDGCVNLRKTAESITVLVLRTGASSADQVRLDDLEPHALPLERSDAHGMDVRRVPLAVAVGFTINLENATREPLQKTIQRIEARASEPPCQFDFKDKAWQRRWKSGYGAE
jgi:hypothetical protein